MSLRIVHYFDYKSPYAYLVQEEAFDLAREPGVEVEFLPYTLDIESFLGAAALDAEGSDQLKTRTPHQWRRVRYAYRDARREARRRGLTILGPRRIFDSSVAHIGMLFARDQGSFRRYHELAFERFFQRAFDPGDPKAVESLLREAGLETAGFGDYLAGAGRELHDRIRAQAEDAGVFGVPSFLVEGELYWGGERLPRVREHVEKHRG